MFPSHGGETHGRRDTGEAGKTHNFYSDFSETFSVFHDLGSRGGFVKGAKTKPLVGNQGVAGGAGSVWLGRPWLCRPNAPDCFRAQRFSPKAIAENHVFRNVALFSPLQGPSLRKKLAPTGREPKEPIPERAGAKPRSNQSVSGLRPMGVSAETL